VGLQNWRSTRLKQRIASQSLVESVFQNLKNCVRQLENSVSVKEYIYFIGPETIPVTYGVQNKELTLNFLGHNSFRRLLAFSLNR